MFSEGSFVPIPGVLRRMALLPLVGLLAGHARAQVCIPGTGEVPAGVSEQRLEVLPPGAGPRGEAPGAELLLDVMLGGRVETLELEPFSLRVPGFEVLAIDSRAGVSLPVPGPRTVRGRVRGHRGSCVAGSVLDDGFHGGVRLGDGRAFAVQPLAGGRGLHSVVEVRAPERVAVGTGGTGGGAGLASVVFIADTDHDFFLRHGRDPRAVVDDVELLTNLAAVAYERDTAIGLRLSRIVVRRDGGLAAYPSNDTHDILGKHDPQVGMPARWAGRFPRAVRDFVVLFSGKDLELRLGGLVFDVLGAAWLSGIEREDRRYCVVERLTHDHHAAVNLAHEIGHLWGAAHCTEPCNTIMKGGTDLSTLPEFGPLAVAQITGRRDLLPGTPLGEANVVARRVHRGSFAPGGDQDIRELDVSDDRRLVVHSDGRHVDLELELHSPGATSSGMELLYEHRVAQAASSEIELSVSLFDWNVGHFLPVEGFPVDHEEFLRRVAVPDPQRFVGTGAARGLIRARIEAFDGSVVPSAYAVELDLFRLLSRP